MKKFTVSFLIVAFAFAVIGVTPADAATNVSITGNTNRSWNRVRINHRNFRSVNQSNFAKQSNVVDVWSSTGGNTANNNTGQGTKSVSTGMATTTTTITNSANSNQNTGDECDCVDPEFTVNINDNTGRSRNTARIKHRNTSVVHQSNVGFQHNGVYVGSNSGDNHANSNTGGGDVSVTTGDSDVTTEITNEANMNVNM